MFILQRLLGLGLMNNRLIKIFMKKFNFLSFATFVAVGLMTVACASSSNDKKTEDSIVVVETEVVEATVDSVSAPADAVISYGGKLMDVPKGAEVSPASIKEVGHVTLVEFGATWCGPCKKAKPIVENLAGKYEGKAEFLYVDIDENPGIAKNFGVGQSIPVVVVANADGTFEVLEGLNVIAEKLEDTLKAAIAKK